MYAKINSNAHLLSWAALPLVLLQMHGVFFASQRIHNNFSGGGGIIMFFRGAQKMNEVHFSLKTLWKHVTLKMDYCIPCIYDLFLLP